MEDNPDLRNYSPQILSEYYLVCTATNGQEALALLASTDSRSLILSDIMMPVMDSLKLLEKVKTSDLYRHIPMVMLTARSSMKVKLSTLQLGVDDYITKPFHEEELLARIQNILTNQAERLTFLQEENEVLTVNIMQTSESDQNWLLQVESVVAENMSKANFNKKAWADKMLLSERQLRRKVTSLTGLTLTKYIQLARLKDARRILESGEKSTVGEVS